MILYDIKLNVAALQHYKTTKIIRMDNLYLQTGVPHKSACNCMSRLFVDIIPSVCNFVNGNPQSLYIASRISLV